MTEERGHESVPDERVSRAYRSHAVERTPPSLDRKILERASGGPAASRLSPAIAVAATIVLAVAVVLAIRQQVPAPVEIGGDAVEPGPGAGAEATVSTPRESRSFRSDAEAAASELGMASGRASDALGRAADNAASECAGDRHDEAAWRRCIETLEAAGRHESAAAERALLESRSADSHPPSD